MKFRTMRLGWPAVLALSFAAFILGRLRADDAVLKELNEAVAKLAAGTSRTDVVAARNTLLRIAHQAARPGAEKERAEVGRALGEAYARTDLVEPRNALAEILSWVGGEESVKPLAAALTNPASREMARFALTRIHAPAAARALREALEREKDPDFEVALINSLGAKRDPDAVKVLEARVGQKDRAEARLASIEALSRIAAAGPRWKMLLEALPAAGDGSKARDRLRVFDSLVILGETLISAGKSDRARDLYRQLLHDAAGSHEKSAALIGLGRSAGAAEVELVRSALKDEAGDVRGAALEALAAAPGGRQLELVAKLSGELDGAGRASLLRLLATRKEPEAAQIALTGLSDADSAVRAAALHALEGREDPKVVQGLLAAIEKGDGAAKEGAVGVLGRIPGEATTKAIARMAKAARGEGRTELLLVLGRREDRSAAPVLLEAARSEVESERAAAYEGLGNLHRPEDLPVLIAGLERAGRDGEAAERALARQSSPEAMRAIHEAAKKKSGLARARLLTVVGRREGPEEVALLLEAAKDPDEAVRSAALLGLAGQKDPAILPVLLEAAERGPEKVRPAAVLGCLRFGRAIEEKDRAAALRVYERALSLAARNEEKIEAIQGLGRLADPSSIPALKPVLTDRNRALGREAAAALLPIAVKLGDDRKAEAVEVLREALAFAPSAPGAREATERLRKLGVDIDLAREAGFVTHWWLLGPFPVEEKSWEEPAPLNPDAFKLDEASEVKAGEKTLRWKHHHTSDPQGAVNLEEAVGRLDDVAAYAYAEVTVPAEKRCSFKIGSDDSVVVWLNGKKIHAVKTSRGLTVDQDNVNTRLQAGKNVILLKVLNSRSQWAYCLRITDRQGGPEKFTQREKGPEDRT
jgi:HEAT repeat protein